jgi:hypothetical protein
LDTSPQFKRVKYKLTVKDLKVKLQPVKISHQDAETRIEIKMADVVVWQGLKEQAKMLTEKLKARDKTDGVEDLQQLSKTSQKLQRKILIQITMQLKRPALQDVVEIESLRTQMHLHVKIVLKLKTKQRGKSALLVNQDP